MRKSVVVIKNETDPQIEPAIDLSSWEYMIDKLNITGLGSLPGRLNQLLYHSV